VSETVGHLPWKISIKCSIFLKSGGDIIATVTSDLVQGGLKLPGEKLSEESSVRQVFQ